MTTQDANALKLHTAPDGTVWFADGVRAPVGSGMSVPVFAESLRVRAPLLARVIGSYHNAPLITAIYPQCQDCNNSIEVASPRICETARERSDPPVALYRMREMVLPSSLGGWHHITARDYPSYLLAATLARHQCVTDLALEILRSHPVWRYLQFISTIAEAWAATVVGLVIDPRWFIDTTYPDRTSRLRSYMGVLPRTQEAVSAGHNDTIKTAMCQAVLGAWKSSATGPSVHDRKAPGNFLWRIYHAAGGGARGDLKASQAFLCFLHHAWLEVLADPTCRGPDALFVPDMLFHHPWEVEAFKRYIECSAK